MTRDELKLLVTRDEMVVKSDKHGTGKGLTTANNFFGWNQNVSDRPVQTLQGFLRLALGTPRGPTPRISAAAAMMEIAMVVKDRKFVVMLAVHNTTYLRPSELCNRTGGHLALPRQGPGANT